MRDPFVISREKDEAFWQEQEVRLRGVLGQPCCTLSGMCSILRTIPGRFAVVVHGEADCLNSFHHHDGPSSSQFFTTGLTEHDLTTGRTEEPLRSCLQAVTSELRPEVVFVLGTCAVEMIGDRFERVVADVAKATGVPMLALHTSGLALGSQAEMLDWLFEVLASLPPVEPADPGWYRAAAPLGLDLFFDRQDRDRTSSRALHERSLDLPAPGPVDPARTLNLVGLPEMISTRPEVVRVIEALGLSVGGIFPYGATLNDWRAIRHAACAFVTDPGLYPRLVKRLADLGQKVVAVPLPVGVWQSEAFYRAVAREMGTEEHLEAILADVSADARHRIDAFRERQSGIRMAVGIRMLNNYRADQLAYEGLGDIRALEEMGFELTLFVQGPPEEDARRQFAEALEALGCGLPFEVFPDPWSLGERLAGRGFDVAYLADHGREEARKAGLPMIVSRGMEPFFEGVPRNLAVMEQLLDGTLTSGKAGAR